MNFSYGKLEPEEDRIEEHLVETGKSYDFGDYGTIEIIDIVHEGNKTLMKVRTTGAQSRLHFYLTNGKEGGVRPSYDQYKNVLGILEMEVTYVFDKLDSNENYYIEVPIEDEKSDFKVLTDDIIKLELN